MAEVWAAFLARLAAAVVAGAMVGWLFGAPGIGSALGLAAVLLVQLARLRRLLRWFRDGRAETAPDMVGPWGELIAIHARLLRRKQFHKRRLLRVLRELRRFTAAMPEGVVVLNAQGEILWFNRTAARLLGLRGKGDVGLRIENLVRQPEFVRYLRLRRFETPVIIRTSLGGETYLSLQVVPYGQAQQMALVRDVTAEMRLAVMRRDFIANASHELRSPLTVIAGYLETLAPEADSHPDLAGPLREMRHQAQRMTRIVEELLQLSRLESSDEQAPKESIDVAAMMLQLREDVRGPRPALTVETKADSTDRLLGEPAQVRSAFSNLVDNAVKYSAPDGTVCMRWWTDEQGGHFSVADNGIGIAPEHIPRLTERFYRVDAGRSRATGGTGLGLAIVKHILQRHGAHLVVESQEGRGSTFTCHFPRDRVQPRPEPALPAVIGEAGHA